MYLRSAPSSLHIIIGILYRNHLTSAPTHLKKVLLTEPEEGEGACDGEAAANSREEKEAREMEEGYRDFEGEDEQEYQSFVQSLDM